MKQIRPLRVFISYSHDSPEHCDRVLLFANNLIGSGIDVELDQFHASELINWPRWCHDQIEYSDFIVCVCTPEYYRCVHDGQLPNKGKGVFWEAGLLDDQIYDEKGNRRIIPVLFGEESETAIPGFLRGWTFCRLEKFEIDDEGFELLIRILTGQKSVEKNELGPVPDLLKKPFTPSTTDENQLLKKWSDSKSIKPLLVELFPTQAELLATKLKLESEYFQKAHVGRESNQFFRPIVFHSWGIAESDTNSSGLMPKAVVDDVGLAVVMADFPGDVMETLRWIRHSIVSDDDFKDIPVVWIPGRSLIEETLDQSSLFVRGLLEAPLEGAIRTLDKLGKAIFNTRQSSSLVILIDFNWLDIKKTSSNTAWLGKVVNRMLDLNEALKRNCQTLVLGIPRHFLMVPDIEGLMDKVDRAWVAAPLFTSEVENRKDQLAELLSYTNLPTDFKKEIAEFLTGKVRPETVSVDLKDFPSGLFVQCNSNSLIYAIVAELDKIKSYNGWQYKLAEGLRKRGFWDPAIRLAQYSPRPSFQALEYVTVPVDIYPCAPEGIYGHLDGAEEIPLAIQEGVLHSEGGGGKTTVLMVLEHLYSLPRTDKAGAPTAWLPLLVSEELRPLNSMVNSLLSEVGTADIECLLKIFSSPLYLLIDNVDEPPKQLATLRKIAQHNCSRLGVLLTHRIYPGLKDPLESFEGIRGMEIRTLTPELARRISREPIGKIFSAWSMIDMPHARLCQNPFMLRHCAAALFRSPKINEDRALTDIIDETLSQGSLLRNNDRKEELYKELLPLLAHHGLKLRKAINEDELEYCLNRDALVDEYDMGWLKDASDLEVMIPIDETKKTYVFRHAIYQEYFAARYLAQKPEARSEALRAANQLPRGKRWYNCLRLMMPLLAESDQIQVIEEICNSNNDNTELFGVLLSGLRPLQLRTIVFAAVPAVIKAKPPENALERKFMELCDSVREENLTVLGYADPRIFPLILSKGDVSTTFDTAVAERIEEERWGTTFELNGIRYKLAKYPVTNFEFHQFVNDGGYDRHRGSDYWDSQPRGSADMGGIALLNSTSPERPRYWALASESRTKLRQPNCPVVGITLHEANAYCRWLSKRDGAENRYRLPTASEWTWAAYFRWPSIRQYMMFTLPDCPSNLLSSQEFELLHKESIGAMLEQIHSELANKGPAPVGIVYDSKSGCSDLFGNVWEWCNTLLDDFRLYVRGGPRLQCSLQSLVFDGVFTPNQRNDLVGFRILRELDTNDKYE